MLVEDSVVVFRVLGSDTGICAHGIMIVKWCWWADGLMGFVWVCFWLCHQLLMTIVFIDVLGCCWDVNLVSFEIWMVVPVGWVAVVWWWWLDRLWVIVVSGLVWFGGDKVVAYGVDTVNWIGLCSYTKLMQHKFKRNWWMQIELKNYWPFWQLGFDKENN